MDTTEKLTRLLALERMKKLSDLYVEGAKAEPTVKIALQLNQINAERIALRDEFMKVIHGRPSDEATEASGDTA